MAIKLLCDWNSHKKGEIVNPEPFIERELILLGLGKYLDCSLEFVEEPLCKEEDNLIYIWNLIKNNH